MQLSNQLRSGANIHHDTLKTYVHFDAALNLVWLCLGAVMLILTVYTSARSARAYNRAAWLRLACTVVIAVALFPCVSATDDLVWMERASPRSEHQSSRSDSTRLLLNFHQASEATLPVGTVRVGCTFVLLGFLLVPIFQMIARQQTRETGRSPPAWTL